MARLVPAIHVFEMLQKFEIITKIPHSLYVGTTWMTGINPVITLKVKDTSPPPESRKRRGNMSN